ncbi:DUF916 domain-containing protein [Cryobacterium sp. MDB1-18-2]|uniref:DUF916 domain-containing protein n=1 Tax=Cryobacterium glucosi TaxID=1259175 RepID=A0ABY2ILU3_9MICO|nr:DUF916 domain-containing protein [Cryobacterium glucosi]TFC34845.1 DUF916 domain-containing protein [Cryobacterium sp. MDB1-18-2]TFC37354.1 DUF916 domain-containing protein [Cryobacterium sp. MDB1-18-1]
MSDPPAEKRTPIVIPRHSLSRSVALGAAGVLVTLGLTLTLGVAGAWAADGSDGIAGAPSSNGGVDQDRSRFTYQVDPGQVINDEYLVENTGTTTQAVTVYATDAYNAEDGTFALLEGSEAPKDAGSWVTFENGTGRVSVTLEPGAQQVLPFTMKTPAEAKPGDHAGGIVVSALSPAGQVSVDRRVAIRLYVRVKGLLQPALTISSIESAYEGSINPFAGDTKIRVSLTNTGNVSLGANTVSQVKGIFGIPLSGLTDQEISEMLPGSSRTVTLTVSGVGAWVYLNPHVSLVGTIDPDALNPGALPTAERDSSLVVVPWAFLLLLLVAAVTWLIVRLSRKRDSTRAAAWIEYTEAEARRKAREEALVGASADGAAAHNPTP